MPRKVMRKDRQIQSRTRNTNEAEKRRVAKRTQIKRRTSIENPKENGSSEESNGGKSFVIKAREEFEEKGEEYGR